MKIVVIGTSNSVMGGNGFVKALKLDHEVIQLSSGRVPFFYHIKMLENNKELIESSDLLLIDHYINDLNFYLDALGQSYNQFCEDFYTLLSSINTRILNVFFPIFDLNKRSTFDYYERVKNLSNLHSLSVLDLNETPFSEHHFKDNIHLTHDASYAFGIVLGKELLLSSIGEKPKGGDCESMPFKIVNIESIKNDNQVKVFSNSLMSIKYLDVKNKFIVNVSNSAKLLSFGYLRIKNNEGNSGVMINDHKLGLRGVGYFHESIDFNVFGSLEISPVFGEKLTLNNLMERGITEGDFSYCYLTEFFFYDKNSPFQIRSAERSLFTINLPKLLDVVDRMSVKNDLFKLPKLQNKTINILRQLAISQESENIEVAFDLMTLANLARPTGSVIKAKLIQYQNKLDESNKEKNN